MYDVFEKLLKDHNVTPYKVSKETGISYSTLSDWKAGRSVPKTEKLKKIAAYFDISIDQLMGSQDVVAKSNEYLSAIKDALIMFAEESFSIISNECKTTRIKKDLTEKYVSNQSNVPLYDYLSFEEGKIIDIEYVEHIMAFLEIDYAFVYGLMIGRINYEKKELPDLLNSVPLKDSTKQIALFLSNQDPEKLKQIMDEALTATELNAYLRVSEYFKK